MSAVKSLKDRNVARAMPTNAVGGGQGGRKVVLSRAKPALWFLAVCFKEVV